MICKPKTALTCKHWRAATSTYRA